MTDLGFTPDADGAATIACVDLFVDIARAALEPKETQ